MKSIVNLHEALGNKTLVLLQQARRARYTNPFGRLGECGGWYNRVCGLMSLNGYRSLS